MAAALHAQIWLREIQPIIEQHYRFANQLATWFSNIFYLKQFTMEAEVLILPNS